jgi:hypothetical protein
LGDIKLVNEGNVRLAPSTSQALQTPYFDSLFAAIVVGSCGGLLGSLFIIVNNKINIVRKKILD